MTRKKTTNAKSTSSSWAEWRKPPVIVSSLALIVSSLTLLSTWVFFYFGFHTTDRQLADVKNSIRILAAARGSEVLSTVDHALMAKVRLPDEQLKQAQDSASLLTRVDPHSLGTWKAVSAIISYRSGGSDLLSTGFSCEPGAGRASVPYEIIKYFTLLPGKKAIVSACKVDLQHFHPANNHGAVLLAGDDVFYEGGQLPQVRIIFYHCRFHFHPEAVPSAPGQDLMKQLLVADLNKPFDVSVRG